MSGLLSDRQKDDLCVPPCSPPRHTLTPRYSHKSMLWYLHAAGMTTAYEALKRESGNEDFEPDGELRPKWGGLLEKKWTSVIRLQKKVCSQALPSDTC